MTTIAIIQARTGSSRYPGKVLGVLNGTTIVELIAHRLAKAKSLDGIVFAIPDSEEDDELYIRLSGAGHSVFRGDENDVQKRYIDAAQAFQGDIIVRITADCPLIDWNLVDIVVQKIISERLDYCSNTVMPTYPDGLDVEAFKFQSLVRSRSLNNDAKSKEHVTTELIRNQVFRRANVQSETNLSDMRWTIDYPEDLRQLRDNLPSGFENMNFESLLFAGFRGILSNRKRNEGAEMGEGQKLWARAKDIIPGGSMLFSKKSEVMLPNLWPAYYKSAKGIRVTDLDGNEFLDFSNMSVGACSLGYGNEAVDAAVKGAVDEGVMSTLNSPQEVALAERLTSLHPWSEMARFARSGGEANAIAVRIARAFTGKDKIAICGYHGWHDWYLSANLNEDDNLKSHLMDGIPPKGIPRALSNTVLPFFYNDLEALSKILDAGDVAAVKMEVSRSVGPEPGFLEGVRELCNKHGAVLIFDECTSGFRETFGGLHLKYGVYPDLAMFGKALGNGYAISAVIGRADVMRAAEETFISSTFWTERLGPSAALATLDEMERVKSWEIISEKGRKVRQFWSESFERLGLDYSLGGIEPLPDFKIETQQWREVKTFITQEMLKKGFLAGSTIYCSTQHDQDLIQLYYEAIGPIFESLSEALYRGADVTQLLDSEPIEVGFTRLN
jgi:glutamate-1-semialdehyde 2,1-aminomutase